MLNHKGHESQRALETDLRLSKTPGQKPPENPRRRGIHLAGTDRYAVSATYGIIHILYVFSPRKKVLLVMEQMYMIPWINKTRLQQ